ncbi:TPA: phage tail protein [Vibrio parahaemolyticus]|nr:phage tail protein [Vibrio parahaemolyticus]
MANSTDKSILTAAGKALLAQLNAEEKALVIDKMIFANVPNRPEYPQPDDVVPTDHIVHQEQVEQRGRLSADTVIYTTTLTSDVGPFDFNWTGAYCSEYGVLVTIDHHALTTKTEDEPGVTGNTLVRSVVLEYKDIAEITNITVDASSWQYNATKRMKKMDSDVAQSIIDQNGKDWFIEDGFLVTPSGSAYSIKAGAGYVSGQSVAMEFNRSIQVSNKPSFIYIDAHREGTPTGEQVTLFNFIVSDEEKEDYTDESTGKRIQHYVCKLANVHEDGSVSDYRKESTNIQMASALANQLTARIVFPANPMRSVKVGDILPAKTEGLYLNGKLWYSWSVLPEHKHEVVEFKENEDYGTATLITKNGTYEFVTGWVHAARTSKDVRGWGYIVDESIDSTECIKKAIEDVSKYSELYVPGGGMFGMIPLRKEIKLTSDNTPIKLAGVEGGFMSFDSVKKLEIVGFSVVGDENVNHRQRLFAVGAGSKIGTLIIQYNNVKKCVLGISAGFENGRTVENAYIMYNKVSEIKGTAPGEGYGIHVANDRYAGSSGELYIAYNDISECQRHSIYCARSNGFKVLFNTIKKHRHDVSDNTLRAALNLARSSSVIAAYNEFEDCHDGCIAIGSDEVDGNIYDASNVKVFGNNIINPRGLAPIFIGYLEYNKGKIHSVSVYDNTFFIDGISIPVVEFRMGKSISFSRNKIYYTNITERLFVSMFTPIGDVPEDFNDMWVMRDNEIYINESTADVYLYRFGKKTEVPMYLLDNISTGHTHVASVNVNMEGSVIYIRGQVPEKETGIRSHEIQDQSRDKGWHETSAQIATPNGHINPEYKGQELFLSTTGKFWKSKGLSNTDWIEM